MHTEEQIMRQVFKQLIPGEIKFTPNYGNREMDTYEVILTEFPVMVTAKGIDEAEAVAQLKPRVTVTPEQAREIWLKTCITQSDSVKAYHVERILNGEGV